MHKKTKTKTLVAFAITVITMQLVFISGPAMQFAGAEETTEVPIDESVVTEPVVTEPVVTESVAEPIVEPIVEVAPESTPEPVVTEEVATEPVVEETAPIEEVLSAETSESVETNEPTLTIQPELTTDKPDYQPGETVSIFGRFFRALENIVLKIFGGSAEEKNYTESTQNVTTDEQGFFVTTYILDNIFRPLYTVIANALSGEELTRTTFTDAPLGTDFKQCANGTDGSNSCNWIGSILQQNNSTYYEGMTVPERLLFTNIPVTTGNIHTLTLSHQVNKATAHAYDFITSYNQANNPLITLNPCNDFGGGLGAICTSLRGGSNYLSADAPDNMGTVLGDSVADAVTAFESLYGNRQIKLYGNSTITNAILTFDGYSAADEGYALYTLTWTSASNNILIEMAGHLSVGGSVAGGIAYGPGKGSSNISGGPYHFKLSHLDTKSLGSQDNQIKGADILIPNNASITLDKNTVPSENPTVFSFTTTNLSPSGASLADGTSPYTWSSLSPGTYTITESIPSGWTLTSVVCTGGSTSVVTPITNGVSINLTASENLTCTFTNTLQTGHIIVVKDSVPNDAQDFSFTNNFANGNPSPFSLDDDADGTLSNTRDSVVTAGTYSVSEGAVAGWTQTSATCSDGSPISAVVVSPGETVTCTFTNTKDATLTLVKTVTNDNGGNATAANFQAKIDGNNVPWGVAQVVSAASHTASEVTLAGYVASSWGTDCATNGTVTLAPGENKTCTITNDDQPGTLIVKKIIINDNGGTKGYTDFSFQVNGGNTVAFEADGQNDLTVNAGTYNVTEPTVAGYSTSYNNCSSLVIPNGGSQTCTITNDDIQPKLTVTKVVVNDNGGTKVIADFPLFVDLTSVTSGVQNGFNVGAYIVSETGDPGYAATITGDCDAQGNVSLALADVKSCTITNNDIAPTLKLVKTVTNDNGGTAVSDDWTLRARKLCAAGNPSPNCGFSNLGGSGVFNPLLAGIAYNLSEQGPAGYAAGNWSCDGGILVGNKITLALDEDVICTINNDDIQPQLIVIKYVINNNGGTAVAGDFTMNVTATNPSDDLFPGAESPGTTITLDAGSYSVDESVFAGYSKSLSADCVGTITIGQTKTCTITNDDIPAKLTIIKDADPNDCQDFTFSMTGQQNFLLDDDNDDQTCTDINRPQSQLFANLSANTLYTVTELIPNIYWKFKAVTCVVTGTQTPYTFANIVNGLTITLNLADDVTCTFLNEKQSPTRTQGFWKAHTAFTTTILNTKFTVNPLFIGQNVVPGVGTHKGKITTAQQLFGAYYSNNAKTSTGAKRSPIDQARIQLLHQLLTAKLNCATFGCQGSVQALISQADAAYAAGTDKNLILSLAGQLDGFNNSGDTLAITATGKATPKDSQSIADIAFWNLP